MVKNMFNQEKPIYKKVELLKMLIRSAFVRTQTTFIIRPMFNPVVDIKKDGKK